MDQNTSDWIEWRNQGLGSSDAPIIMGVSPWCTPYELWELKTGRRQPEGENFITARGHRMEPIARAHYELEFGITMPPTLAVHYSHPWLRASLDGYNKDENVVLEIKCPGEPDHMLAVEGKVPEKYYPQLQHQLMVTAASRVDYFSFFKDEGERVIVYPDIEYILKLANACADFWSKVCNDIAPPFVDADFSHVRKYKELKHKIWTWQELLDEGDIDKADNLRESIFSETELKYERMRCGEYYIFREEKRLVKR